MGFAPRLTTGLPLSRYRGARVCQGFILVAEHRKAYHSKE
jgi:hypothetical protein